MTLEPYGGRTWSFRVIGRFHLDAPQKAKSKVAEEHDVDYRDLRARVVFAPVLVGGALDPIVVVAEVK